MSSPIHPGARGFRCVSRISASGAIWTTPSGELDLRTAPLLAQELRDAGRNASLVILDLRSLAFMDLSGVAVVVEADRDPGFRLLVVAGGTAADHVLELTGIGRTLEVYDLDRLHPRRPARHLPAGESR